MHGDGVYGEIPISSTDEGVVMVHPRPNWTFVVRLSGHGCTVEV